MFCWFNFNLNFNLERNMKLKLLVAAAIMAASAPTFAAMDDAATGNGSLLLNVRYYNGSATSGANDMSALFDLGVNLNDVLAWNGQSGYTQTWSLNAASFGSAWNDMNAFAAANGSLAMEYNVIALDSLGSSTVGGSRYLTTYDASSFVSLGNANLNGFSNMNAMVTANNSRGTHATEANGASTAVYSDPANTFFGALTGDTWATKTTADTTRTLATAQNFWYLTTSSTVSTGQAVKTAFGVDLDGDNVIEASNADGLNEFGEWSVNAANGTVSFTNPTAVAAVPVPAAAWLLASGLIGMVGVARRKAA